VLSRTFAHEHLHGIGRGEGQQVGMHQGVIEHGIGHGQRLRTTDGDEVGIARACAYEGQFGL
jgi:hypothetical protein